MLIPRLLSCLRGPSRTVSSVQADTAVTGTSNSTSFPSSSLKTPPVSPGANKLAARLDVSAKAGVASLSRPALQSCLQALDRSKEDSNAYVDLGCELKPGERVRVGSRTLNRKQCFVKALRANPDNPRAYLFLGLSLEKDEKVTLNCGFTSLNKTQCYRKTHEKKQLMRTAPTSQRTSSEQRC